jgi:hypothetical protein
MTISHLIKKIQSSMRPIAAWIILASCLGLFFSRQLSLIGGIVGTILWLLGSITKKQLPIIISFAITTSLAFTIQLPITNVDLPVTVLAITVMFWGLILTTTTLCLHYLFEKTNDN